MFKKAATTPARLRRSSHSAHREPPRRLISAGTRLFLQNKAAGRPTARGSRAMSMRAREMVSGSVLRGGLPLRRSRPRSRRPASMVGLLLPRLHLFWMIRASLHSERTQCLVVRIRPESGPPAEHRSGYPVSAPSPSTPSATARSGVKQHRATMTDPGSPVQASRDPARIFFCSSMARSAPFRLGRFPPPATQMR